MSWKIAKNVNKSKNEIVKNKFIEIFGVIPYSIEKDKIVDGRWIQYFAQSKFNECIIAININTLEAIRWA